MTSTRRAACAVPALVLALACASAPVPAAAGQRVSIVHALDGQTEGASPQSGLAVGRDGALYGTAYDGGDFDSGTLFRVGTDGTFTVLHTFALFAEGENPSGVIEGADGDFYGTTRFSGWDDCSPDNGGTVYRWSPATSALTVLHCFTGADGFKHPSSALVQATDGNLYGVADDQFGSSQGAVYRISPDGRFATLHRFTGVDGSRPHAALVQGRDGFLYGTTSAGGDAGMGVVYRISLKGKFSVLHSFAADGHEGTDPEAGLIQASDGSFYGTAREGGIVTGACGATGCGSVFAIDKKGNFRVLHLFDDPATGAPVAPLMQAPGGKFYGTTVSTVFRMTSAGVITTVGQVQQPFGGLVLGPDGLLYGTESTGPGGARYGNAGAVFSLPPR
jgi:uncharacterized repeat protein (TIGR03803 family)